MPEQMPWREAIIKVLKEKNEAMHYTKISDEIIAQGLRTQLGATPASTVNVNISDAIRYPNSPFERTARGVYRLSETNQAGAPLIQREATTSITTSSPVEESEETTGLINALGMYWSREKIDWNATKPKILGQQAAESEPVDFCDQRGVYLLYDRNLVIYVGRAIDRGVGIRLREHVTDRLNSRWDRFSWFGVQTVSAEGLLEDAGDNYDRSMLIATMEALLIESVEPTQNRRRGDDFRAVEFLQTDNPEIERKKMLSKVIQLLTKSE